jgi:glycosyltransferase involved in cell wall biosynthesis
MVVAMSEVHLSAVVIAQNSADVIERCLKSLQFADEIVVVDALSHDGTPEIARRLGARVISNKWPGFGRQFQLAIDSARGDWVFRCDTDEWVPDALAEEIRRVIRRPDAADGYRLLRRNKFLGRWVTVGPWANDIETRLYRHGKARISPGAVHMGEIVDGRLGRLRNEFHHDAHPNLAASIARMNWYTSLEAGDRVGRRRIHLADPLLPPLGVFLNYYLRRGCWRLGTHGFLLSATTAMYKSLLYIKIYLLQRASGGARPMHESERI